MLILFNILGFSRIMKCFKILLIYLMMQSLQQKYIIINAVLQESCNTDEDCYTPVENEVCGESQWCECGQGFMVINTSTDQSFCMLEAKSLGWSCEYPEQCSSLGKWTSCFSNYCKCIPGAHMSTQGTCEGGGSIPTIGLGMRCTKQEHCESIAHSKCYRRMCKCSQGYFEPLWSDYVCLPVKSSNPLLCLDSFDCGQRYGNHVICKREVCNCEEGSHNVGYPLLCQPNKGLGISCNSSLECYLPLDQSMGIECGPSQICSCSPGFMPSQDRQFCVYGEADRVSPVKQSLVIALFWRVILEVIC